METRLDTGKESPRMNTWQRLLVILAGTAVVFYGAGVLALIVLGRRSRARAPAGFIPDCLVLIRRLLGDSRIARRPKVVLVALVVYLASPIDLVPDFIPVAGQLDDAIIAALALRYLLRATSVELMREHWPGPDASLDLVIRIAGTKRFARTTPLDPR